jgi:hypothetical protein
MTNDEGMTNVGKRKLTPHVSFRNSGFVIVSTFDIRASSFRQAALRLTFSRFIVKS